MAKDKKAPKGPTKKLTANVGIRAFALVDKARAEYNISSGTYVNKDEFIEKVIILDHPLIKKQM